METQYGKYLSSADCATVTKAISKLTFIPIFTEADIINDMFDAALNNQIKITEVVNNSAQVPIYLKYLLTPSQTPILECKSLSSAYIDINGDNVNELMLKCDADTLILRHLEGTVYVYPFTYEHVNKLNTDGSYSWNHTDENFEYGAYKLMFDGILLKEKSLWKIVNDGEPNAEYYIGDKKVTNEEILKYFEDNPTTKVEFSPLELSWLFKIKREDAIKIATDYWKDFNIAENGYRVTCGVNSTAPDSVHVVILQWYVTDHFSTIDEIWIDRNTGETIVPDGKG